MNDYSVSSHLRLFVTLGNIMASDPRVQAADLRALIYRHSREFNFQVRSVAFATNEFDEELEHLFGMPATGTYSSAALIRFDRELREFIRTLVRLKLHMYRYKDAIRPLERQLMALNRGPMLNRRTPLGERRPENRGS